MGCLYLHIDYASANMYCINWPCKQWFSFAFSSIVCINGKKRKGDWWSLCVDTATHLLHVLITLNLQTFYNYNMPFSKRGYFLKISFALRQYCQHENVWNNRNQKLRTTLIWLWNTKRSLLWAALWKVYCIRLQNLKAYNPWTKCTFNRPKVVKLNVRHAAFLLCDLRG